MVAQYRVLENGIERDATEAEVAEIVAREQAALVVTAEMVTEARRAAYAVEADHLFFSWQAAAATDASDQDAKRTAWLNARSAIQTRYPYPED